MSKVVREMKNKTNNGDVNSLFNAIKETLKNDSDLLNEFYNQVYHEKLDIDYIINVFNVHKDSKFGVKEMYKQKGFTISNNYVPYGVVGLSINNYLNPYQIVSIIEMIIENHNSLIINTKYHQQFISLIVLDINKVLEQDNNYNKIVISDNDILDDNLDLLLYIGRKDQYDTLNVTCQTKYYGIGLYELYVEKELDSKLIEEAKKQGVIVKYGSDITDLIFQANHGNKYAISLMSKNDEDIRKFIIEVQASYILLNTIPTLEDRINIDINDLCYFKSIILYK
jgi:hypothetical protein